jgi:hypothetical protein
MLLLGVVALAGLRPWATTTVTPHLAVAPGLGAALGESAEVAPAPASGPGGVAAPHLVHAGPAVVAAKPVPVSGAGQGKAHPVLAVSAGSAVAQAEPNSVPNIPSVPPPPSSPEAQPVAAAPAPAPVDSPVPVAAAPVQVAGVESPPPRGPATAGSGTLPPPPQAACEGDEYVVTLSFESLETAEEESGTEILVQRLASDDDESEFHLEGTLSDAHALIDLLVSEGNCVQVVEPPAAGEPAAEIPLAE